MIVDILICKYYRNHDVSGSVHSCKAKEESTMAKRSFVEEVKKLRLAGLLINCNTAKGFV